jgi:hypothetical protein
MSEVIRDYHYFGSCRQCGCQQQMLVNLDDINRWNSQGVHIQDAMPYLTVGEREREFLISETCEPCFDKMFADCE